MIKLQPVNLGFQNAVNVKNLLFKTEYIGMHVDTGIIYIYHFKYACTTYPHYTYLKEFKACLSNVSNFYIQLP